VEIPDATTDPDFKTESQALRHRAGKGRSYRLTASLEAHWGITQDPMKAIKWRFLAVSEAK